MAITPAADLTPAQRNIFDSMVELLKRAGLEYRGGFVEAAGHRVHYLDYGAGPPVLLVHGGGAGGAIWFRQIAALSRRFRVIAPDNPIFGMSSQPDRPVTLPEITTGYLTALMDALDIETAAFAGLSMGGFGAALTASEHPERVSKLVLVDSAGFGRNLPWGFRLTSVPVLSWLLARPHRWAHERFFAATEVVKPDAQHNDAYLEYAFHVTANEGHSLAVRRNMPVFAGLRGQRRLLTDDELRSIKAKTLIIWGEDDRFFPVSHGERAAKMIAGSKLVTLPHCGHVAMLDQPDRINELLLEFLPEG
jgi:pimeloyl-ACP methyl ester carboxylesterase